MVRQLADFQEDLQLLNGGEGHAGRKERGGEGVKRVWGVGWVGERDGGVERSYEAWSEWRRMWVGFTLTVNNGIHHRSPIVFSTERGAYDP